MRAYLLDEPDVVVEQSTLDALGVLYWKMDVDALARDGKLAALDDVCTQRGYTYRDTVDSRKIPALADKLEHFKEEHLHDDEEIRLLLDGSGFFDVRDTRERWVRMAFEKGDMIILPAGSYHRFVPDEHLFFVALRLFVGEPVWTPYNRAADGTDARVSRKQYVDTFLASQPNGGDAATATAAATAAAAAATTTTTTTA